MSDTKDSVFSHKTVCVITGPTKGLGKSIALLFADKFPKGSLIILLSRNEEQLKAVQSEITALDGKIAVYAVFDQGTAEGPKNSTMFESCLQKASVAAKDFDQAILINNAGTLEPLDYAQNLDDLDTATEFFKINQAGCVTLTATFLKTFTSSKLKMVINISSLAAIQPMKTWLLYCMAKASRDMMLRVLSAEDPSVRTLSYAPGPLYTDMLDTAANKTKDPELRSWMEDGIKNKTLLECDDTTKKLISILEKNEFENAAHIDYYDEV